MQLNDYRYLILRWLHYVKVHYICYFQVHWLKTDFDKWRDEDDSDVDEDKDMQFEEVRSIVP